MKALALFVLLVFAVAAMAQAEPRSIQDCENIKGDLAYNQCLATFGPKVGERRSVQPATGSAAQDEPAVERGRRGGRYANRRGRGGRQSASFDVGGRKGQSTATSLRTKRSYGKRSYRRRR